MPELDPGISLHHKIGGIDRDCRVKPGNDGNVWSRSLRPRMLRIDCMDGAPDAGSGLRMSEVVSLTRASDDTMWAVMASVGRTTRVAEIFPNRIAALADRAWREQQVRAYASFLLSCRQAVPRYSVAPIRRTDLPRAWRPLPALGFLRGQFV